MNHVLKQEVDWKENKLPVLIQHVKNVVDRHQAEMEKAVINGSYVMNTITWKCRRLLGLLV